MAQLVHEPASVAVHEAQETSQLAQKGESVSVHEPVRIWFVAHWLAVVQAAQVPFGSW